MDQKDRLEPEDRDEEVSAEDFRADLEERSRDRADGRFDGFRDYRGERREDRRHRKTFEVLSISLDADRIHDWGLFQFIACIIIAAAIVVLMSLGRQDVYWEASSPYFFCREGFARGIIIALLLVLVSNTVRVALNALSVIVESSFRNILNDLEKHEDE